MNHRFYIWLAGILFVIIIATIFIVSGNMDKVPKYSSGQYRDDNKQIEVDKDQQKSVQDNTVDTSKESADKGSVRNDTSSSSNNNAAADKLNELDSLASDLGSEFADVESETDTLQDLGSDADTGNLGTDLDALAQ